MTDNTDFHHRIYIELNFRMHVFPCFVFKDQQLSRPRVAGHRDSWQFGPHRGHRRLGDVEAAPGAALSHGLLRSRGSGALGLWGRLGYLGKPGTFGIFWVAVWLGDLIVATLVGHVFVLDLYFKRDHETLNSCLVGCLNCLRFRCEVLIRGSEVWMFERNSSP